MDGKGITMTSSVKDSPDQSKSPVRGKWVTLVIWAAGIGLQLSKPWIIRVFKINTEMFMQTVMGPLWAFLLVSLLAGWLRIFRDPAEKWRRPSRLIFALVSTVIMAIPQIDFINLFRESDRFPHYIDELRLIMFWVTPLVFFVIPSLVVIWAWLNQNQSISTRRALGMALVIFELVYIPFGLWFTPFSMKYIQP
jgi:hypothetical protein